MLTRKIFMASMLSLTAIAAGACSDNSARLTPVAPSSVTVTAPSSDHNSSFGSTAGARGAGPKVAGQATVASLSGTCPDLRMVMHGIRVTTNESTTYENGECGNLRAGTKAAVEGEMQPDHSVVAENIRILDQPGGMPVEGEGNVGARFGTCPTLTMVVHGYPVMTTSETTFVDGECEDIRPGTRIAVKGTFAGGSVLASEVTVRAATTTPGNLSPAAPSIRH